MTFAARLLALFLLAASAQAGFASGNLINPDGITDKTTNNINIEGSGVHAAGTLTALADGSIDITASTDTASSASSISKKSKGILSSKTTTTDAASFTQTQNAATLTGDEVSLIAGGNLAITASNVNSAHAMNLMAGYDMYILSAENVDQSSYRNATRKNSGLFYNDNITTIDNLTITQQGSNLTAGGPITAQAGRNLLVIASDFNSGDTLRLIAGNEVAILAGTNIDQHSASQESHGNLNLARSFVLPFRSPSRTVLDLTSNAAGATRTAAQSTLTAQNGILIQSGGDTALQAPIINTSRLAIHAGVDAEDNPINTDAKIYLLGVKESNYQQSGHNEHSFIWDNIADVGGYQETLLLPTMNLGQTDGKLNLDLQAPGGLVVGATDLAPTQYEIDQQNAILEQTTKREPSVKDKSSNEYASMMKRAIGAEGDPSDTPPAPEATEATETTDNANNTDDTPVKPPSIIPIISTGEGQVIDLKAQAEELAKQPGMEWIGEIAQRDDVDWQKIQLATQNWDYHHSGLSQEGATVIAIVVTIVSYGTLAKEGAALATSVGFTSDAAAAAVTAGLSTLTTQATIALINNHGDIGKTLEDLGNSDNVKAVLASMATAGITKGVMDKLQANGILAKNLTNASFGQRFATYATRAAINAGVQTVIMGQPLSESLQTALIASLTQSLTSEIGDMGNDNLIAKTLAHAIVQCASASLQGQDCQSAATGAAIAELLSGPLNGLPDTVRGKEIANLIVSSSAMLVAELTDQNTMTAANAAQTVEVYNRQLHWRERDLIRTLAKEKATETCSAVGLGNRCVAEQTARWVDAMERVAESLTDKTSSEETDAYLLKLASTKNIPFSGGGFGGAADSYYNDLLTAKDMLSPYIGQLISGAPMLNGAPQTYFSATGAQFNDPSGNGLFGWSPSIIPGMAGRDADRLAFAATPSGSVEPVYFFEEMYLGGVVGKGAFSLLGRVFGALGRGASVWELPPVVRGEAIEKALGQNLPKNFPVIDKFNNGVATSIKSVDLNASSYQSGSTLNNTINRYIDSVADYVGTSPQGFSGQVINPSQITGRGLDLVIPNAGSAAQQQAINQAVQYGISRGVNVNVIIYP